MDIAFQLIVSNPGDGQGSDSRDEYLPVSIHCHAGLQVDFAPDANEEFVSRTQNVVGGNRNAVHGRKRAGDLFKQLPPVNGKGMARGVLGE
jgi:hypothetical protein